MDSYICNLIELIKLVLPQKIARKLSFNLLFTTEIAFYG